MLVSVIIPSFRQPQFLARAIESCLEQDHADLEVIVVEDNSRDASLAIAAAFARRDDRVRVVACPDNGGLGRARNIGVAHSSGEYLCFLDSDDYLLERSISARLDAFPAVIEEHGPGVVGVYGDWQHVAETIDHPIVRQPRAVMPVVQQSTYTGENVFICSAPLGRRGAVIAAGGFPEGLRMLEDFALWARIIAAGGVFVPVHHMVSTYRQRPNSMLRGDGLVLMSDHAQIINDWMAEAGTPLADGGALTAWLEDRDPRSYGRMSWSVPSLLGSFGGTPDAASVSAAIGAAPIDKRPGLSDFMAKPVLSGTDDPPPVRIIGSSANVDVVVHADSLARSLEAVSLIDVGRRIGINVAATVPDLGVWEDWWPLVLLDADVIGSDDPRLDAAAHVDLASPAGSNEIAAQRIRRGADVL
jgi:teichuronic acid biosynthesis glycosyltransferase TuaG